ncbi:Hypothetical protein CAP_0468 [Chondromyces apiculatus DSM 436]|uniref:Uncharacterized protein n=1 Tax=Chondromyces apiculatus DSM 436 TaxID=1192034 RepID=A0A017SUC7_9BACT|nr:Hypothetical protein CAP_0468 [Chondromyces apiculatus DSM 436]
MLRQPHRGALRSPGPEALQEELSAVVLVAHHEPHPRRHRHLSQRMGLLPGDLVEVLERRRRHRPPERRRICALEAHLGQLRQHLATIVQGHDVAADHLPAPAWRAPQPRMDPRRREAWLPHRERTDLPRQISLTPDLRPERRGERLQRRIEQRGVRAVGPLVSVGTGRQPDPRERLTVASPQRFDAAKGGTVRQTQLAERRVQLRHRDRAAAPGAHCPEIPHLAWRAASGHAKLASSVLHPSLVRPRGKRLAVHRDLAATLARLGDHHVHAHRSPLREHQRCTHHQPLHARPRPEARRLRSRPRQLQQRRSRHHNLPEHPVIRQIGKRLRTQRRLVERLRFSRRDPRAEQRVPRRQCITVRAPERGRILKPVPLSLPWIRRQRDDAPALGVKLAEIDRVAMRIERREGHEQVPPPLLVAPQRGDGAPLHAPLRESALHVERQDRVRAHLHEGAKPVADRGSDRAREMHGRADVLRPVGRIERFTGDEAALHGAVHRARARARPERTEGVLERVDQGIHLRAVEGVVHAQRLPAHALPFELREDLRECRRVPRQHHRARVVDRRDGQVLLVTPQRPRGFLERQLHGRHLSQSRRALHDPAAEAHEPDRFLQVERASDVRRRHLPDAVADHRLRHDTPRRPQRGERHLDREDCRLGYLGLTKTSCTLFGCELAQERVARVALHERLTGLDRSAEDRLLGDQRAAHPHPLRSLTGEYEHDPGPGSPRRPPARDACRCLAAHQRIERGADVGPGAAHHGQAVRPVAAPDARGVRNVAECV